MLHVGFTGTRRIALVSPYRMQHLRSILKGLGQQDQITLHHGDAVGMDAQAHRVARDLEFAIHIHPPVNPQHRAYCATTFPWKKIRKFMCKDYLTRNRDIVNKSDVVVAVPVDPEKEERRSGTWHAIRYAKKQGKKLILL